VLTEEDHRRIEAAVASAEEGTSGRIFCVLAGEVSGYGEIPIAWAAAAALIVPPAILAVAMGPLITAITAGGWTVAEGAALSGQLGEALTGYAALQVVLFAVTAGIVSFPPVRRFLTPAFVKRHRVKRAAFHHFAAAHAHSTESETGVLLFIALVDRQVQVLADAALHAKAGDAVWQAAARAVQEGMRSPDPTAGAERAIAICGEALKAHFPSSARRTPDRVADV
jgi:putative membrane protein